MGATVRRRPSGCITGRVAKKPSSQKPTAALKRPSLSRAATAAATAALCGSRRRARKPASQVSKIKTSLSSPSSSSGRTSQISWFPDSSEAIDAMDLELVPPNPPESSHGPPYGPPRPQPVRDHSSDSAEIERSGRMHGPPCDDFLENPISSWIITSSHLSLLEQLVLFGETPPLIRTGKWSMDYSCLKSAGCLVGVFPLITLSGQPAVACIFENGTCLTWEIAKRKAKAVERAAARDLAQTDAEEEEESAQDGPAREPVQGDGDANDSPEYEADEGQMDTLQDTMRSPVRPGDQGRDARTSEPSRPSQASRSSSVTAATAPRREPPREVWIQRSERWKIETSKALSQILRHSGQRSGLRVREDGYASVKEVLKHPRLRNAGATLADVQVAVTDNAKQRFQLSHQGHELLIRATQGHSMQQVRDDLLLTRITAPEEVPLAVHGTYLRHYASIYQQGLRAGRDRGQRARKHIHFAMALPRDQHRATSGMRTDVEILIYLDISRALRDGMHLYVSTNSVVLSEGFNGCIPIDYMSKVQYMHRHCACDVPGDPVPSPGRLKVAFAAVGVSPREGGRGHSPAPERVPKSRRHSRKARFDPCLVLPSLIRPPMILSDFDFDIAQVLSHPTRRHQAPASAARHQRIAPSSLLFEGPLSPHPRHWQARPRPLLESRRNSRRSSRKKRSSQSLFRTFLLDCPWCMCSQLAWSVGLLQYFSVIFRPGGGPRQHYRPDGIRRRTAGEITKRAARAAAKAGNDPGNADGAATGAAGSASATAATPEPPKGQPKGPPTGQPLIIGTGTAPPPKKAQSDGPMLGAGAAASATTATASQTPGIGCPTSGKAESPTATGSRPTESSATSSWTPMLPAARGLPPQPPPPLSKRAHGKGQGRAPPPAPKKVEWVPKRSKAPPPGITVNLDTATENSEKPASPAKRSVPITTIAPTTTPIFTQAAPNGEPASTSAASTPTLTTDACQPKKKRRSKTVPPPSTTPDLEETQHKWDLLQRVHTAAVELQDAEVPYLLHLYQSAGGYISRHNDFHAMRDRLTYEGVVGPYGVPLPLPPVGNYILSLGVSILDLQHSGYLTHIRNSSTFGDLIEAWSLTLWESSRRDLLEQLGELFTLLHCLISNIPRRIYDSLSWRITLDQLTMVFRTWLGTPSQAALAVTDQDAAVSGPPDLYDRLFRARSLSPRSGPLSGSRPTAMAEDRLQQYTFSAEAGKFSIPQAILERDRAFSPDSGDESQP
ncbi:unnamed protein product, partial [Symbiodinium sp. CCMP2592]